MTPTEPDFPPALADFAQLDAKAICAVFSWSRSHLYAMVRAGTFPAPIRYGRRCSRWQAVTVREWAAAQGQA